MNNQQDGGEAILEAIRNLSIEYVISSPGSEWPAVWEALARQKKDSLAGPKYLDCGHETLAVFDGAGALEAAEKLRPDVVLLDIGLPHMSGYEVCRRLRDLPWGQDLVVMAVTGWGQGDEPGKWQQAGFDAHVVKPAQYDELMALLSTSAARGKPSPHER